ncbi:hypothetical protein GCM10009107_07350 [Ideonella azotifigens]|uniref:histidine kinase n=2 Tax=Ideonella azotifigens TaxID=513160 RepID=A0ABP3UV66_9BURK
MNMARVPSEASVAPAAAQPHGLRLLMRPHPAWGLLIWGLAAGLMAWLDGHVDLAGLAMLPVLAAALAALCLPLGVSLALSALAVLAFNWWFVPPRGSFQVDLRHHALLLGAMLLVNWIVTWLMVAQRRLAAQLARQARHAHQLRELGEALRAVDDPLEHAGLLFSHLAREFQGAPVLMLLQQPKLPATDLPEAVRWFGEPDDDTRVGLWLCLRQSRAMGPGTGRHEELRQWLLPLRGRHGARGAVSLPLDENWLNALAQAVGTGDSPALPEAMRAHAQALCDQMGAALEHAQAARLTTQARQLAQEHATRNALLAAISHDYRTPLATMLGAASSLQDQGDRLSAAQRRTLLATVIDEIGRLGELTENTLQLARLSSPGVQLRLDWESAEDIVGAAMRRAGQRHPQGALRARVEPGLPLLRCDALLLAQLLDNLIANALKYGGDSPVELLARAQPGHWVLAVRDRGPGVPPEWRQRIFDVFQRGPVDLAATERGGRSGAGVGLAVCRAIAEAHGGMLRLRARGHGGSSFECWLPLGEAAPEPAKEATA